MGYVQFISLPYAPLRVQEVIGYKDGKKVDRSEWRGSNLQKPYVFDWFWDKDQHYYAQKAWHGSFTLSAFPKNSKLVVAIKGKHGIEGAVASFKVNGKPIGPTDRIPSYRSNTWEYRVQPRDANYTFLLDLKREWQGSEIEVFAFGFDPEFLDLEPEVWLTTYPTPYEPKLLTYELK
jgi:hypothetical protein